jgi:hypothetical protein
MMVLFMQIEKKISFLLLLSPWIIYAKRTAGDKKRREKKRKRLSITSHPSQKKK